MLRTEMKPFLLESRHFEKNTVEGFCPYTPGFERKKHLNNEKYGPVEFNLKNFGYCYMGVLA
jgi:hypothetical protein